VWGKPPPEENRECHLNGKRQGVVGGKMEDIGGGGVHEVEGGRRGGLQFFTGQESGFVLIRSRGLGNMGRGGARNLKVVTFSTFKERSVDQKALGKRQLGAFQKGCGGGVRSNWGPIRVI